MKFVILDEVDYMTKNAQQALKYLLQNYSNSVRFCLICNYISRIDEGLQNEFIKLRFNQLPEKDIIHFLHNICLSEKIQINKHSLKLIQQLYKSDIRSMINFIQSNQSTQQENFNIIDESIWLTIYDKIVTNNTVNDIKNYIYNTSIKYNLNVKNLIKDFLNYLIRNKSNLITTPFLNFIENIMHFEDCKIDYFVNYTLLRLEKLLPK
jgi:DNA polymerase III delta prime subunit